jgi:hypothetical protein
MAHFFPVNELVDSGLKFFLTKKISTHCQLIHSPGTTYYWLSAANKYNTAIRMATPFSTC